MGCIELLDCYEVLGFMVVFSKDILTETSVEKSVCCNYSIVYLKSDYNNIRKAKNELGTVVKEHE